MNHLEQEIFNRIKLDDEKAFELLFKTYYGLLCNFAFDLLNNKNLSEEVVQEVFIKIWENRASLSVTSSLKAYLFRSIHNNCLNVSKHIQVIRNKNEKYSEYVHSNLLMLAGDDYALDDYFYEGLEDDIEDAIQSLPEQCRIIFRLSRFELLSHKSIALKLGISVNTVKTQIGRALEKLRDVLNEKINNHQENPSQIINPVKKNKACNNLSMEKLQAANHNLPDDGPH